jgi:hypothetical protein
LESAGHILCFLLYGRRIMALKHLFLPGASVAGQPETPEIVTTVPLTIIIGENH